jgi:hypothetical protein
LSELVEITSLNAHHRPDSLADRQPFQNCPVCSIAKASSLVCCNHERITVVLVAQVTSGEEITQPAEQ